MSSLWESSADVAEGGNKKSALTHWVTKAMISPSSSKRILGLRIKARAIAIRCFCPPESCEPLLPTRVSKPSGKLTIKSYYRQGRMSWAARSYVHQVHEQCWHLCKLESIPLQKPQQLVCLRRVCSRPEFSSCSTRNNLSLTYNTLNLTLPL